MKKFIFILSFTFMMFLGINNVKATDIDFADVKDDLLRGNPVGVTASDTLTFQGETWIGNDGRITLTSGKATLQYTNSYVNITLDGDASINKGKQFILQLDLGSSNILPVKLIINSDMTLNIDGSLAIPSGSKGILANNGTVNINGNLEVRSNGTYESTGQTNLYGNLAFYRTDNNIGNIKIMMYENGNVYSQSEIKDNLVIGEKNTDNYIWEITNNDKKYTSITANLDSNFIYGYTLAKQTINDPMIDDKNDNSNNIENPQTSDNILIYVALAIIAVLGIITTLVFVKKEFK